MLLYFLALFLTLLLCRFTESKLLINYMQKESYVSLCNISMQKNISDFIRALVFGFPLFIVSALRYNVGTDYQSYLYDIYSTSYNIDIDVEPFFKLLYKIIAVFHINEQWFFVITSFIVVFGICYFVVHESPLPTFSICIFWGLTYYFCSMNGIRQFVGITILMISLIYVRKRKIIPFIICVAIATCCHISCAVFSIVYFIYNIRITRFVGVLLTAFLYLLRSPISSIIVRIASYTKYSKYFGGVFDTGSGNVYRLIIHISILLFCSVFFVNDKMFNLLYKFQLFTVWVFLFSDRVALLKRFAWTFGTSSILLIAIAVSSIKEKKTRIIIETIISILFIIYCTLSTVDGIQGCYPYQWIGEKMYAFN